VKYKSIWGERPRKFFWEASLTGDLVCGNCERTMPLQSKVGILTCSHCKKEVELTEEIVQLARSRERAAFPKGRPPETGQQWKGEDPYGS